MKAKFRVILCIALLKAFNLWAYDAAIFFALNEDLSDFSSSQPLASQPIQVGNQKFYPFMNASGRFIAATTKAGLLETMEPVSLGCGRLNAKRMVSFGLAGAISDQYSVGDVVIVRSVGRHDRGGWLSGGGFKPKSTDLSDVSRDAFTDRVAARFIELCREKGLSVMDGGRLVSGDAFISSDDYRSKLAADFNADLVDMNSAAFTAVSESFKRPCLIVRVISDKADAQASEDFSAFVNDRARCLKGAVQALADSLREAGSEKP